MAMNPRLLRPLATFNPRNVPGLELWFDAADDSSVTTISDPARVSLLTDKSGKGRNATNTDEGITQPLYVANARNGRNAIRFNAADVARLTIPDSKGFFNFLHNGTPSHVVVVASAGVSSDPNAALAFLGTNRASNFTGFSFWYDDRASIGRNNGIAGNIGNGTVSVANILSNNVLLPEVTNIIQMLVQADNATAADRWITSINGGAALKPNTSTAAPVATNAQDDFQLGASGNNAIPLTGDICEVLLYSQHPTLTNQIAIRKYLSNKWGVALA